jgi:wyosine [tRNA(Phe)-imidazoG37] synthetase (radical SAM superfamily)
LGLSLGVDLIPFKTCTYDCLYCQLGRTTKKCVSRKEYVDSAAVIDNIQTVLSQKQRIDYITFSGSGEPTLHSGIGSLIRRIKELTAIPVAVITNSSLLNDEAVRDALLLADLVVPSLDAGTEETFHVINRPHGAIQFGYMVDGLARFSHAYAGTLWLEIMFVAGMNDSDEEITALRSVLEKMRFDRIQMNTVFRPPAEKSARPVKVEWLQKERIVLGDKAEIVTDFRGNLQDLKTRNEESRILELVKRRPATVNDMVLSLGIHRNAIIKYVAALEKRGRLHAVQHEKRIYYEALEG